MRWRAAWRVLRCQHRLTRPDWMARVTRHSEEPPFPSFEEMLCGCERCGALWLLGALPDNNEQAVIFAPQERA